MNGNQHININQHTPASASTIGVDVFKELIEGMKNDMKKDMSDMNNDIKKEINTNLANFN